MKTTNLSLTAAEQGTQTDNPCRTRSIGDTLRITASLCSVLFLRTRYDS